MGRHSDGSQEPTLAELLSGHQFEKARELYGQEFNQETLLFLAGRDAVGAPLTGAPVLITDKVLCAALDSLQGPMKPPV